MSPFRDRLGVLRICWGGLLGCILLTAALAKAWAPGGAVTAGRVLLGASQEAAAILVAIAVCTECFVGLQLLRGSRSALVLCEFFALGLVGFSLLAAATGSTSIPCGCFGDLVKSEIRHTSLWVTIAAIVTGAVLLACRNGRRDEAGPSHVGPFGECAKEGDPAALDSGQGPESADAPP